MPKPSTVFASCGSRSFCSARIAAEIIGAIADSSTAIVEDGVGHADCKAGEPDQRAAPARASSRARAAPPRPGRAETAGETAARPRTARCGTSVAPSRSKIASTGCGQPPSSAATMPTSERNERRKRQHFARDVLRARALARVESGDDRSADGEREEASELICDQRELHAFASVQRFDHRKADEGCIAEPADERQRADARTRPMQCASERRE